MTLDLGAWATICGLLLTICVYFFNEDVRIKVTALIVFIIFLVVVAWLVKPKPNQQSIEKKQDALHKEPTQNNKQSETATQKKYSITVNKSISGHADSASAKNKISRTQTLQKPQTIEPHYLLTGFSSEEVIILHTTLKRLKIVSADITIFDSARTGGKNVLISGLQNNGHRFQDSFGVPTNNIVGAIKYWLSNNLMEETK